jgi:hypothetical protein
MTDDPVLNYVALGMLFFVVVVLFYGIIAIHDIPYLIAKSRNHPHGDAIHAAGWVSLFTLHALWPFLWIWAMTYRPERGWGFSESESEALRELAVLQARVLQIETRVGVAGTSAAAPAPAVEVPAAAAVAPAAALEPKQGIGGQ